MRFQILKTNKYLKSNLLHTTLKRTNRERRGAITTDHLKLDPRYRVSDQNLGIVYVIVEDIHSQFLHTGRSNHILTDLPQRQKQHHQRVATAQMVEIITRRNNLQQECIASFAIANRGQCERYSERRK
jgi:hypothetical protein